MVQKITRYLQGLGQPSLVLALLPGLCTAIGWVLQQQKGPYWVGSNLDPEYAYLLNALNILNGRAPAHIDHPGTPLQLLGAGVLWVSYNLQSLGQAALPALNQQVLSQPEFYLGLMHGVLLGLIALSLFLVGWLTWHLSQNLVLGLILQSAPLLTLANVNALSRMSPEPLLMALTQGMVALLLVYLFRPGCDRRVWFALSLGGLYGLGMATKITFLPLGLGLLLLPGLRRRLWGLGMAIATFLLATLPIFSRYRQMQNWFTNLATHTGTYGTGAPGVIAPDQVGQNGLSLVTAEPIFFGLVLLSTLAYLLLWRQGAVSDDRWPVHRCRRLLGLLLLILGAQILITVKHPGAHYLLPAMNLSGLLVGLQLGMARALLSLAKNSSKRSWTIGLALVLALAGGHSYDQLRSASDYYRQAQMVQTTITEQYSQCRLVDYYRASSVEYALKMGNDFAGRYFSSTLQRLYPDRLFYNIWLRTFESFNRRLELKDLNQAACLILRGTPFSKADYQSYQLAFSIRPVTPELAEAAYQVFLP